MRTTELDNRADLEWLIETHLKGVKISTTIRIQQTVKTVSKALHTYDYVSATLYGNETGPNRVELFTKDHYRCRPYVFTADENGNLQFNAKESRGAGRLRPKTTKEKEAGCL